MATFRHEIFIKSPIEKVFATVADTGTHSRWQGGLLRSEGEGNQQRVGARGVEVRRIFGRGARFPYEINVDGPPREWGFRALDGPVRPSAALTFNGQNDGTLVKCELTIPGILGFLFGGALLAQQQKNYARLQELLETGLL
jgi:uncharacterized protein YndB with AHSA1/START domain